MASTGTISVKILDEIKIVKNKYIRSVWIFIEAIINHFKKINNNLQKIIKLKDANKNNQKVDPNKDKFDNFDDFFRDERNEKSFENEDDNKNENETDKEKGD
jgi:hypothetical protein